MLAKVKEYSFGVLDRELRKYNHIIDVRLLSNRIPLSIYPWIVLDLRDIYTEDFINTFSSPYIEKVILDCAHSLLAEPNDPLYPFQWHLNNTGQKLLDVGNDNDYRGLPDVDIDAPEAWNAFQPNSKVIIAVTDTGVDYTHQDIQNSIWINEGELQIPRLFREFDKNKDNYISRDEVLSNLRDYNNDGTANLADLISRQSQFRNLLDTDNNGYRDDLIGWDFGDRDNDPIDEKGHGTLVAGIAGATTNNNKGIAGTHPNVLIMPLKFMDGRGNLFDSDAISATLYAADNGAFVSNNSYGENINDSDAFQDAINYLKHKEGVFVAAVGNLSDFLDREIFYPVSYDNVVGVAAVTAWDERRGSRGLLPYVEIGAPGEDIISLRAKNVEVDPNGVFNENGELDPENGQYYLTSGTSIASPVVAGVLSLVKLKYPQNSADDIVERVISNAEEFTKNDRTLKDIGFYGSGRVNLYNSLMNEPRPILYMTKNSFTEIEGNGNQLIDPGETIAIEYTISNYSSVPARNVIAELQTPLESIDILSSEVSLGTINKNTQINSRAIVRVHDDVPYNSVFYDISLHISADNNYEKTLWLPYKLKTWQRARSESAEWDKIVDPRLFFDLRGKKIEKEYFSPIILNDFNGDSKEEMVFVVNLYGTEDALGKYYEAFALFSIDGNGDVLPGFPVLTALDIPNGKQHFDPRINYAYGVAYPPAIGDIDSDGLSEIVLQAGDNSIFVWDVDSQGHNPQLKSPFPLKTPETFITKRHADDQLLIYLQKMALADISGDSSLEIVVAGFETMFVINGRGEIKTRPLKFDGESGNDLTFLAVGKLGWDEGNPSSMKDNIAFNQGLSTYVFKSDLIDLQLFRPVFPLENQNNQEWENSRNTIFADFNRDGALDILSYSYDPRVQLGNVSVIDKNGYSLNNWPIIFQSEDVYYPPYGADLSKAIADIDNDGSLEVVMSLAKAVKVWNAQGAEVLKIDLSDDPLPFLPIVDDIDGDGDSEILWPSAYSDTTKVRAVHHDGTPVAGFPKTLDINYYYFPMISIGDLDNDKHKNVVGIVNTVLYNWELEQEYSTIRENGRWPMVFRDARNSNTQN